MKTTVIANERKSEACQITAPATSLTTLGAALGTVFTLPVAVDAAVVYSGIQNISASLTSSQRHASNFSFGSSTAGVSLDLDGNAVPDFGIGVRQMANGTYVRGHANIFASGANGIMVGTGQFSGGEGPLAVIFNNSYMWSGGSEFGGGASEGVLRNVTSFDGSGLSSDGLGNGQSGFVGVNFDIDGNTHFGWIRLVVDDGPGGFPVTVTAKDWAYNDVPGAPIHISVPELTPEVPEANPGLVLLAAGGTGLVAWRLRRRQMAKQA